MSAQPQPSPAAQLTGPAGTSAKPPLVTTIAIMTLVSGLFNLLSGVSALAGGVFVGIIFGFMPRMFNAYEFREARFMGPMMRAIGVITFILLVALAIYLLVLAFLELRYSIRLLGNPPGVSRPARHIAVMEIIAIAGGNVIAGIVGVLALVFYNEPAVQAYFAALSSPGAPADFA